VCLSDKDLVSKPADQVEETEPGQRHQFTYAGPAIFLGHGWTPRRSQLLPPRSRRRRSVPRRSPLPLRRAEGHRLGPDGTQPARVVWGRAEGFRFRVGYLLQCLSALSTVHAADILTQ